jgi:hypothetical protein
VRYVELVAGIHESLAPGLGLLPGTLMHQAASNTPTFIPASLRFASNQPQNLFCWFHSDSPCLHIKLIFSTAWHLLHFSNLWKYQQVN